MKKEAVVVHSGGMDSSICLALAIREFGADRVLSLSFSYRQRHAPELAQAAKIAQDLCVDHVVVDLGCLAIITRNALVDKNISVNHESGQYPNTLVVGRNGLMAQVAGIYADRLEARCIYMGVMELEGSNSGYRDCSRKYMDLQQEILRIDLNRPEFEIRTPLIRLNKKETMDLALELGILPYLLQETITCYEGLPLQGCRTCPACKLRNDGIAAFVKENPSFILPYEPIAEREVRPVSL